MACEPPPLPKLRLSGIVEESIVDGPGLRFVIFTQGCPHNCPGCHNPETHDPSGGYEKSVNALLRRFSENPLLSGITFSGGEPFDQALPLSWLAEKVHALGKDVTVYSGYTLETLQKKACNDKAVQNLLQAVDVLIDGPYIEAMRDLNLLYRGSSNQRLLYLKHGILLA